MNTDDQQRQRVAVAGTDAGTGAGAGDPDVTHLHLPRASAPPVIDLRSTETSAPASPEPIATAEPLVETPAEPTVETPAEEVVDTEPPPPPPPPPSPPSTALVPVAVSVPVAVAAATPVTVLPATQPVPVRGFTKSGAPKLPPPMFRLHAGPIALVTAIGLPILLLALLFGVGRATSRDSNAPAQPAAARHNLAPTTVATTPSPAPSVVTAPSTTAAAPSTTAAPASSTSSTTNPPARSNRSGTTNPPVAVAPPPPPPPPPTAAPTTTTAAPLPVNLARANPAGDWQLALTLDTCSGIDAGTCNQLLSGSMYLGVRCPNGQCSVSTVSEFPTTALRWDAGAQGWVATGSVTGTQFQFKCSGVPQPTAFRVVLRPTASAQQNGALVASAIGGTYERTSPNGACGPATLKYAFRTTAGHPQP